MGSVVFRGRCDQVYLTKTMKTIRALVVEDNLDDAELMLHGLERAGYQCTWKRVDSPEPFRAAIEEESWDIILADFRMPQFSGPAALDILRESGKDIPLLSSR